MTTVLLPIHIVAAVCSVGLIIVRIVMAIVTVNSALIRRATYGCTIAMLVSGLLLTIASGRSLTVFCLQGLGFLAALVAAEIIDRLRLPEIQ